MKKLIVGSVMAFCLAAVPFAASHAEFVPPCAVAPGLKPEYSTLTVGCDPYYNDATGQHYDGFEYGTPKPNSLLP